MAVNWEFIAMSFPHYNSDAKRLKSFEGSTFSTIDLEVMANAGFFYAGSEDKTICYYCGGGLRDWEEGDDPWVEHARWFARCPHVLLKKGKEFVDVCCGRRKSTRGKSRKEDKTVKSGDKEEDVPTTLQCIVCLTKLRSIAFFPCGHCCVCTDCCSRVDSCSYCRARINTLVKIYLP